MNRIIFDEAMNQIDENYLACCLGARPRFKKRLQKYAPALIGTAALVCLASSIILVKQYRGKEEPSWPAKTILINKNDVKDEIYRIPHWEDMEIYEQYSNIEVSGKQYNARGGIVESDRLGNELGTQTAQGYDEYAHLAGEEAERFHSVLAREIKGISPDCAIAIRYSWQETFYAAINPDYRPETLHTLVTDLNLENTLQFNFIDYDYVKKSGEYCTVRFENLDDSKIWEFLKSCEQAESEPNDQASNNSSELLSISISIPLLGYENISICLYEDGYLATNILDTGKIFYVGNENVLTFFNYVLDECEGYELIYQYTEEDSLPESALLPSPTPSAQTIQN